MQSLIILREFLSFQLGWPPPATGSSGIRSEKPTHPNTCPHPKGAHKYVVGVGGDVEAT